MEILKNKMARATNARRKRILRSGTFSVGRRALAFLLSGILCLPLCARTATAQASPPGEYQLKAAFLFNFAKFIDWPSSSFTDSRSDFSICILGSDPFGPAMDQMLQGKTIADRHVAVERTHEIAGTRHCQVVFVSPSEKPHIREILDGLRGTAALIVGDTDGFAAAGGAIQFAIEDNRVRFLINTDATERAGLKVSSKLLSLARVVHDAA